MQSDASMLRNRFFNQDCIIGAREHIPDGTIDLIVTDPPYGIAGDRLDKHYNRKEEFVIDGYVEVPQAQYAAFSQAWIREAERILRPGGSLYVVSGYTNLVDILNALRQTSLREVNHIIWKYNFGVYTRRKFVSSHYHILYYVKPGGKVTFNTFCRFGPQERDARGRSLNYQDREDVWIINREYKPGQRKNKNELPTELLKKILLYSSNEGDLVCDLFLGSFSTARVAIGLNRYACGFEVNPQAFSYHLDETLSLEPGWLLPSLRPVPKQQMLPNWGKPWTAADKQRLAEEYRALRAAGKTKKAAIEALAERYGRGYFSVLNVLKSEGL